MHLILAMRFRLPRLKKIMLHNTQTAQMLTLLSLLRVHLKNRVKPSGSYQQKPRNQQIHC